MCKQHHTLTQILKGLLDSGFALEAVEEAYKAFVCSTHSAHLESSFISLSTWA